MTASNVGHASLVHSLATLLRNDGDGVLEGSSTLSLPASSLQQLTRLFEQYLLPRSQQHGFLALPSHPADTDALLRLQFLFDVLQKTVSLKLINPPGVRIDFVVKIFPFKSLKCLELKRIPPHCLEGLRGVYSQLEVFTCSKSLSSLEELLSLCGGDLSSALPWLELHTLNFSYNAIVCLDQSLSLLNVLRFLDLSHNKIQECAEFLKPLSELEHLNLGYNCLQRAPTLALSSRAKLLTLILRNNELETINGVEQLSSLQHLDLAYNLLLEHSQLAPLSLLHCLHTLNLEGNPLFFQKSHRMCTVRHLSPKAAYLRLRLDGSPLTSSELSVLPKPGQLIGQAQAPPPVAAERGNQEASSGGGELSDSLSVSEVGATRIRRKKSKVKVRRASISEPSDTDYVPRQQTSSQDIVLPHQKEIERMESFREQLGEDWLRYQHHLDLDQDQGPPSTLNPTASTDQPDAASGTAVTNGLDVAPFPFTVAAIEPGRPYTPSPPPPPETSDQETESTLQMNTESTLESSLVGGLEGLVLSGRARTDAREEEEVEDDEENLGVDLCLPLLVGLLSDKEEDVEEEEEEEGEEGGRMRQRELFLRVKQYVVLELDVQRGVERHRLSLDSLSRVDVTQAAWRREDQVLPAVELHFNSIIEERRRRRYVMLDGDPQQALQTLTEVLARVAEENKRCGDADVRPGRVRLQCLRCGCEVVLQGEAAREEGGRLSDPCEETSVLCPECGSDHVVHLSGQSDPCTSTPVRPVTSQDSHDHGVAPLGIRNAKKSLYADGPSSLSASVDSAAEATALPSDLEDLTSLFVTAQESRFFIGEGGRRGEAGSWAESCSLSCSVEAQCPEELSGSYRYASAGAAAAGGSSPQRVHYLESSNPDGALDLLSEDFEAVDHRLKLFLDVEVFEEEEELHSFLKMSAVKYGEPGEFLSLLVVSNQRFYILEMTPESQRGQLSDWLQKKDSHPITELSYLEVGLGSQAIHMEFEGGGVAYTLLVRDSARCKRFFGLLTGVVREMAPKSDSKLRSISTIRLNPHHHLWPLVCEDMQLDVQDGQLQFFYLLAFVLQESSWTPLTVLATRENLYLLSEDHQWRKSPAALSANQDEEPCSGSGTVLETQPISCVSSVTLWSSDPCRMDIQLYDETAKEERSWCVQSQSPELQQGLLVWITTQWENMFGVSLSTCLLDANS